MSHTEIQRFADGLHTNDALREEIGRTIDPLVATVDIAQREGYRFTLDEIRAFVQEKIHANRQLSDGQLDHVTGGVSSSTLSAGRLIDALIGGPGPIPNDGRIHAL
ncbi:hypothetical protein BH11PSE3_BH11PSE3_07890 [soil metagenome]